MEVEEKANSWKEDVVIRRVGRKKVIRERNERDRKRKQGKEGTGRT